jgi:uncharacterized glyoxalase superfamily protein PhnB
MAASLPEGHQHVMPYLVLENADGFMQFVKDVFDAEETYSMTREDGTIGHAQVKIGESTIMFAEQTAQWAAHTAGMFVYVDNADSCYEKALAEGAFSLMPPADQPYGRSSGVRDPFGNVWWITSVQ